MLIKFDPSERFDFKSQCVNCGKRHGFFHTIIAVKNDGNIGIYLEAPPGLETYGYGCSADSSVEEIMNIHRNTGLRFTEKGKKFVN